MIEEIPTQVPCELEKITTMMGGKLRITFLTQEGIQPEIKTRFFENHDKTGWLSFLAGDQNITSEMVKDLPEIKYEKDEKSPSTLLRNILFRLWEQKGKPTETFTEFYKQTMEKLINHYREKLT